MGSSVLRDKKKVEKHWSSRYMGKPQGATEELNITIVFNKQTNRSKEIMILTLCF